MTDKFGGGFGRRYCSICAKQGRESYEKESKKIEIG